jgi:Holliday junction resolvasome RuvABC endonuclease subunit
VSCWSLGIDPSLTHTALVLGEGDAALPELRSMWRFDIKRPLSDYPHEIARLGAMAAHLESIFEAVEDILPPRGPRICSIEGPSYASTGQVVQLGEWGGQIRLTAWRRDWTLIVVPPSTLKKFVTGNGNAEKGLVMVEVFDRWKYKATDNDNADAYGLCRVGLVYAATVLQKREATKETKQLLKACSIYDTTQPPR